MKDDRKSHTAKPDAPTLRERWAPLRPPRPPIGLPLLPDGRTQLPKGNPCEGCDHCCRYIAIEIDRPRTKRDFDNIRWYLLHRNVSVMIDWEGSWLVQFDTPCEWLKEGKCSHYALRPDMCREYDPAECERYCSTPAEKILLRDENDLEKFLEERESRRRQRSAAKRAAARRKAG